MSSTIITLLWTLAGLLGLLFASGSQPPREEGVGTTPVPTATPAPAPTQIPGRQDLYEPGNLPEHMAYVWWWWDVGYVTSSSPPDEFEELVVDFTIHNDVELTGENGLYLMLAWAQMADLTFYFGLQTDVHAHDPPYRRGKGALYSRWGPNDIANARWPSDGWIDSSYEDGDFIGVRRSYDWGVGDYHARFAQDDSMEPDPDGVWYGLWITDLAADETTWIGSLRFPLAGDEALIREPVYSTVEVYGAPIRPIEIPQWHVTIKRPVADGHKAAVGTVGYSMFQGDYFANSEIHYDQEIDAVRIIAGGATERVAEATTIRFPQSSSTSTPAVQVIYAIPDDREENPAYAPAIREAILHVQEWYAGQLDGLTFALKEPIPLACDVEHSAKYYEGEHGWDRVAESVQHCAPVKPLSDEYAWAIYIDVEFDCDGNGELGAGGSGITIVHGGDLAGLVDPENYRLCGFPPRGGLGWVGGLAHEIGHAFGLPHPPGCDEGLSSCDNRAMMWAGFYDYPETYLREDEKAALRESVFFHHRLEDDGR